MGLLLTDEGIHGFASIFRRLSVHFTVTLHPHTPDQAVQGAGAGFDALGAEVHIAAERTIHPQSAGGGDGVLMCPRENKFPSFQRTVEADKVPNVIGRLTGRGIFLAISKDGKNDLAGALLLREAGQPVIHIRDSAGNRVQQGGGSPWDVIGCMPWMQIPNRRGGWWFHAHH